jgi:hypothetical protein
LASNLGRSSLIRRMGRLLLYSMVPARAEAGGTQWPVAREAQALPTVHQTLICLFLRDLDDTRNPSYSLVMVNTGHGGPAVTSQFDQTSTVARSPLGGAPAPRTCTEASSTSPLASRPINCSERRRKNSNLVAT